MKWIQSVCAMVLLMGQIIAFASPIEKVVVFGDSLSDAGNLYEYMNRKLPLSPPYYKGRFSDGPVWVELVTDYLSTYHANIFMENYAFGGAFVLPDDDVIPGVYLSLGAQVDAYLEKNHAEDHQHTLYIMLMGGNDYLDLDDNEMISEKVLRVTAEISYQASRLAEIGAQFILIANLPELGKSPLARELDIEKSLSDASFQHNLSIQSHIQLLKEKYLDTNWIFFDVYSFFTDAFYHPEKYGFKHTQKACYGFDDYVSQKHTDLSFASNPRLLEIRSKNCDAYLFFDIVHPTKKGHEFTASLAIDVLKKWL